MYGNVFPTFRRNPANWREFAVKVSTELLIVVEVVLGCRWCYNSNNGDLMPPPDMDISFPCTLLFPVINGSEPWRPYVPTRLIDDQQPNFVAPRKIFQRSIDWMRYNSADVFSCREHAFRLRIGDLDFLAEPPSIAAADCCVNDRGYEAR